MSAEPNIPGGYVLLARKTLESDLMRMSPLAFKLFFWMLMRARRNDGQGLRRGQLFTTAGAMREACSYMVGFRKEAPTPKQIRRAYEGLREGTMIATTKGTHGMVVTILNYDRYQTPSNYEGHNEGQDEKPMMGMERAQYKQERKEVRKKDFSSELSEFRLAALLFELIRQRNPEHKAADLQAWAKHVDLMMRVDGRTPERIEQVIRWSQSDPFWSRNILSTAKLREKFDALVMKMGGAPKSRIDRSHLAAV
jgi:hypothetical protein